ncbi:hypothetical protein, partial [Bilophila wadsworthia]|uniref:hypothetical protein n=1 Tax=Bilophila wadsworthia TaxID=35833 RepID=UPI0026739781
MNIGEGEGKLSGESFPSPSPNPTPFPSKTFDFIESLFGVFPASARKARLNIFRLSGLFLRQQLLATTDIFPQQANTLFRFPPDGTSFARPPHQSKIFGRGLGGGGEPFPAPSKLLPFLPHTYCKIFSSGPGPSPGLERVPMP